MKYIKHYDLAELAILAESLQQIMGATTKDLYCHLDPSQEIWVNSCRTGEPIGYWRYLDEEENVVFFPVKRKYQIQP